MAQRWVTPTVSNIVEVGEQIRKDITVVMVAPKCPGTEVREEYKRGFGVPTLIAVHPENDPKGEGMAIAKALGCGNGRSSRGCSGVLFRCGSEI